MLVNLFGKQYDKNTATTDMAVPYIGEYNSSAVVNRPRSSVAFMYDRIEEDFLKALSLMDEKNTFFNGNFYFSKRAIYGLLSRFYLYKKDWKNSVKYADLALQADKTPLNIKSLRANTNDHDLYSKNYFDPANSSYLLMGNNTYQLLAYYWSGYYPYPINQMSSAFATGIQWSLSNQLYNDLIPVKFAYFYTTANRNMNMPLITVDEVLFNKAEASLEEEQTFNTTVKADLASIIDNQSFTASAATSLKNEMNGIANRNDGITYLLKLKRLRFYAEGMRWFDLKRHNLPITHNYNGVDFKIDGTNPNDYVIKIPLEEIQFNADIN